MVKSRAAGKLAVSVLLLGLAQAGAWAQVAPHLDILSCGIEELPPIDRENVPGRVVVLRLEINGTPVCGPTTGHLAYGFLIDADSNLGTGHPLPPFDPLGVEARITAICDPASGTFTSRVGVVSVIPGPGSTTIEIRTTVQNLPSLVFRWVAFAQEDMILSRLPQAPDYGHWLVHEKGVY